MKGHTKNPSKSMIPQEEMVEIINPSPFFRRVARLHADRKLLLIYLLHFATTAVIFVHFALKRYDEKINVIPSEEPFSSLKIGFPTFLYATKHAILFQLAVLPITQCRFLIANLSSTVLGNFLPFNDVEKFHIAIGYALVSFVTISLLGFFLFYGTLCERGQDEFCDGFTAEIMITGYAVFILFGSVGVTSYFRFKIPYRLFYVTHHIVFIAYIVSILHTIDVVERKQGGRSQCYKWFFAPVLLYICDRTAMYVNCRYTSTFVGGYAVDSGTGDRMVIAKFRRPKSFHFFPGQHCFIKVPTISQQWKPFSIGSSPQSETLDFYIKVNKDNSWTGKLFHLMKYEQNSLNLFGVKEDDPHPNENLKVQIMGPYGVSLGDKMKFSRAINVGSGTGFVPCLSMLKQHIDQCLKLVPEEYDKDVAESKRLLIHLQNRETPLGQPSEYTRRELAGIAKRQIYITMMFQLVPIFGVLMLGVTLSWNNRTFNFHPVGMTTFLYSGTTAFHFAFFVLVFSELLKGRIDGLWKYVDLVAVATSAVAQWYWYSEDLWCSFSSSDLMYYTLLLLYMEVRVMVYIVDATQSPIEASNRRKIGLVVYEKVKFVWIAKDAASVAQVFPDLAETWDRFVVAWGAERARRSCEILIQCTEKNKEACQNLVNQIQNTRLYKENVIRFGRPAMEDILEQNTREVKMTSCSSTLFSFCGNPMIGALAKEAKIFNDLYLEMLEMAKNTQHTVESCVQTHGGGPPKYWPAKRSVATTRFEIVPQKRKAFEARMAFKKMHSYRSMGIFTVKNDDAGTDADTVPTDDSTKQSNAGKFPIPTYETDDSFVDDAALPYAASQNPNNRQWFGLTKKPEEVC